MLVLQQHTTVCCQHLLTALWQLIVQSFGRGIPQQQNLGIVLQRLFALSLKQLQLMLPDAASCHQI